MFQLSECDSEALKSMSRAFLEGCLSTASGTLFILKLIDDVAQLSWKEDYENEAVIKCSVFATISILSILDAYVHFRMYNHQRYNKRDESDQHAKLNEPCSGNTEHIDNETLLLAKTSHDPTQDFSWPAFICAVSCSIDTASAPLVIMSLSRNAGLLGPTNPSQKIIEITLSSLTTILSAWSAPRLYAMGKKHLGNDRTDPTQNKSDNDHTEHPCPCHPHS